MIQPFLEWAAQEGRVLLTHDVATITRYAYDQVREGQPMPGVLEISTDAPIGRVIEDVLVMVECSQDGELEGQVQYLPCWTYTIRLHPTVSSFFVEFERLLAAGEAGRFSTTETRRSDRRNQQYSTLTTLEIGRNRHRTDEIASTRSPHPTDQFH
jgi:hypothetical protein